MSKRNEWTTVIIASIIVATINVFHVITGLAKTPPGFTYLATGHYYLDYFTYLQYIALGKAGRWLPVSFFSTENFKVDWRFFPYTLLGKIAWLFNFTPMFIYWLAVFLLTFFVLIGFYLLIDQMLKNESFVIKIFAFIVSIVSGPFYKIALSNNKFVLSPFDFWYGPANFIRRFEVVPYHLLGLLLLTLIIILIKNFWQKISQLSYKIIFLNGLIIAILSVMLMTFSPLGLASLIPALLIISGFSFIEREKFRIKSFIFNFIILLLTVPTAFFLRKNAGYGGFAFETRWIEHPDWWFLILNLGPMVVFIPFGLKSYFAKKDFSRRLLFLFTLVSYLLFLSPLALYLGIHNLRFFSSISYVFFGVITALGLKKLSFFFKNKKKGVFIFLAAIFILYSCFLNYDSLNKRLSGQDKTTPRTVMEYVPDSLISGIESLKKFQDNKNVLAGPYGFDGGYVGTLVSIFASRRVYIADLSNTPNVIEKQIIANRFFSGEMSKSESKQFLGSNNIGYVVFTFLDSYRYSPKKLDQYSFLRLVFQNKEVIIYKVLSFGKD